MAFISPAQGQKVLHTHITQFVNAFTGVSGAGEQISLTQYNNSSNYALDVRNLDTTNSYGLRVRDASSNNLFLAYKNNIALGASSSDTVTVNGVLTLSSSVTVGDDVLLGIGTGNTARFSWDTTDSNANALLLQLPAGGGTDVPVLVIGQSVESVDLGLYNGVVDPRIAMFGVGAVTTGPVIEFRKARGTVASPTVVTTGDDLGTLDFYGAVAAGEYVRAASIRADMAGTIATTRGPGTLTFLTATDAAPSLLTAALTLNANQSATFGGSILLPSGAAINWNSGEITITETDANTLTIAGVATRLDLAAGILEMNDAVEWDTGVAVVAAEYSVGRDADGTNQLHFNVPTGATFEFSVNDVVEMTLSATAVDFQNNSITTTGGGSLTGTWTNLGTVTTVDINGGTIDGTIIGGASAAAGTFTALTGTSGSITGLTGLAIRSTGAAYDMTIATSSVFTAGRTLTILPGDSARTITLSGNPTLADWFDQSVKTTANPTFGNLTITSFAANWTNAGRTIADLGVVTTVDINGGTIDGVTIGGAVAGAITGTSITATGLTGATAASRYVGATTSAAPTSGTFAVGDFVIDQTGTIYICITAGTPGTWTAVMPRLYGTGADGAISNLTDADSNATTIAQTGTLSATTNRTFRATGNITISQTITVGRQDGQARGSFSATHGGPGVALGSVLATLGSKGIPTPIRPGGGNTGLCGGIVQFLSGATVAVNAAINATGTNAASDGGGGGGLVVIVAKTEISGSAAIDVSAAAGHGTAAAKGGAGSYSEAPGGHAGWAGSGGGGGNSADGGAPGAGYIAGGTGGTPTGSAGGGGSIDSNGANGDGSNGGAGGDNNNVPVGWRDGAKQVLLTMTAATAGGAGGAAGGAAGANGGGGGGGGRQGGGGSGGNGGNGGDAGAGGGGGGWSAAGGETGGNGAAGNAYCYSLSSASVYAGMPGGQGGGGGGGGNTGGSGGAGASGLSAFVASMGNGAGGSGANGAAGATGGNAVGGAGGAGGNGGGAAGLVLLIAPTVSYNGTITGRVIIIQGAEALNFLRGYGVE